MSSDFDFMEVEFNFGPNYQKGKLTQSSEIKPYCCHLPITMLHNSAAKMTHFCSVTTEKSLTGFPLLMVPTANKLKQTLDVSCGNHLNSAMWHPKNPAVIPMLGSMGGEVHQASRCYHVPQRSS